MRTLFDHFCEYPEQIPASIPEGDFGAALRPHRWYDRSLRGRGVRGSRRCRRLSLREPYTADSRDRVRDAVDMLSLVGTKVELSGVGWTATSAAARSMTSGPRRFTYALTRSTITASAVRSPATRLTL